MNRRKFLAGSVGGVVATTPLALCASHPKGNTASKRQSGRPIVIDAHAHLDCRGKYGDPAGIVELADEAGIDIVCLSPVTALFYDMKIGNQQAVDAARRFPKRILAYANFPSAEGGPEVLEEIEARVRRDGAIGFGEVINPGTNAGQYLLNTTPHWVAVFKKAAALRIPILTHQRPADAEVIATMVPEATILMAHMGNGDSEGNWRRAIVAAQRCPNLYLETCSSTVDYGFIEAAVKALGPERVIFGTDMPLLDPHVQVAKITGAKISTEAKQLILGGNMARLLGL